jgi:cyclase
MSAFPRIIPVLLVSDGYLVKPVKFRGEKYIGDPVNAVRIFNDKQVDELLICDIDATVRKTGVNWKLLDEIASEAFMPVGYGGGVASASDAKRITEIGIEKVVLGSAAIAHPNIIGEVSEALGASSTVVSVDARRRRLKGHDVFTARGSLRSGMTPVESAVRAQTLGAGEILLSSIDREGTLTGYDLALIAEVAQEVSLPVVALGGAGSFSDLAAALNAGASAAAAGSMFVLNGRHRAVLITYPSPAELRSLERSRPKNP